MASAGPPPHVPNPTPPRQPRLHLATFNGTWAGGVLSPRKTVVSELARLISDHENVVETLVNGVGSDISLVDRIFGGVSGWGTLRNVITAYRNLANHYKPGDRIILCGYSRGAWAARYLAMLIDIAGLPMNGDDGLFCLLYKACHNDSIFSKGIAANILDRNKCWQDVKIDALCCFDTVGSLGIPLFGLAKPLSLLRRRKHDRDIVSDVAPNIRFAFHCLSLHETRDPYSPTPMCGPTVHQVFFPGNHGNMGWIEDAESFVHAPFAWMIQQLHSHLHISFDEAKLAARFPSYRPPPSAAPMPQGGASEPGRGWYGGRIRPTRSSVLAVIGKKARQPGIMVIPRVPGSSGDGDADNVETGDGSGMSRSSTASAASLPCGQIHIGARLRAGLDDLDAVPGYALVVPVTGPLYWARRRRGHYEPQPRKTLRCGLRRWGFGRRGPQESLESATSRGGGGGGGGGGHGDGGSRKTESRSPSTGSWPRGRGREMIAGRIEEASIGALEASLLGLPAGVVADGFCCEGRC